MNKHYDVIIVGAGPSGTSCAYNIKRFNPQASVLLLDKADFPRYKPCGGGVSPEVQNYFDFDLMPGIDSVCNEVVMVANGKQISSDKYPLWMVRREKFDNFLLDKARLIGVDFISSCEVKEITQDSSQSKLLTSLGDFYAKVVVIAEGSLGKLAKGMGYTVKNNVLAAMEYEYYTKKLDGKLYIDFDYNDSGYAWNFPKSDGLSLGIGGLNKRNGKLGLPTKLKKYSQQFEVGEFDKKNFHGHPIVVYSGRQKLVHGNIVMIGEIAGCVDPLTAEGIRPAIKSGFLAAKVIAYSVSQNNLKALTNYDVAFHQEIGRDFYYARIMSYFLNQHLARILPMIASKNSINGFMSVMNGTSRYREKVGFKRICKMIWKVVF